LLRTTSPIPVIFNRAKPSKLQHNKQAEAAGNGGVASTFARLVIYQLRHVGLNGRVLFQLTAIKTLLVVL
jgi:hypothetical protein